MLETFRDLNSEFITIPGGCTKDLQPLDILVINSFQRHCEVFRIEKETELIEKSTHRGNRPSFSRQEMITIISKGWSKA